MSESFSKHSFCFYFTEYRRRFDEEVTTEVNRFLKINELKYEPVSIHSPLIIYDYDFLTTVR